MPANIDVSFVRQYEDEVKLAYQRQGSLLRNFMRTKTAVRGMSTTFQKMGTGVAGEKTRNGNVPTMNLDHSNVECFLKDIYAGEFIDKLDELKINHDERQAVAASAAAAMGRKTDDQIITALATTTTADIGTHAGLLNRKQALEAIEYMNDTDIPDDGRRFAVLTSRQWSAMMQIQEFTNSDYVGDKYPFLKNKEHRHWMNVTWMTHSGLPNKTTATADCFMWHQTAVGHAIQQDVMSEISWENTKAAYFISYMQSMGAVLIDHAGVVKLAVDDSVDLT